MKNAKAGQVQFRVDKAGIDAHDHRSPLVADATKLQGNWLP